MGMLLSYGTWGMPTVPIDVAIEHCASLGYDAMPITIKPGWTTDVATLDAAERTRIRYLRLLGVANPYKIAACRWTARPMPDRPVP